jgi:hypothetical protein
MALSFRSLLAKAFRVVYDETAVKSDADYWWLIPQVTPWPPPSSQSPGPKNSNSAQA